MNYLIDPSKITKFNSSKNELELKLLFWVCAAGKKATTVAKALNNMLSDLNYLYRDISPFDLIRNYPLENGLPDLLKGYGIGCYNQKAVTFSQLVNSNLDLKKCSIQELESIKGIGMKTSRCFLIHSRKEVQCAGLDVHILRFLKDRGYDVPASTPSKRRYLEIEQKFLELVKKSGKTVAEYDLDIWKEYSAKR